MRITSSLRFLYIFDLSGLLWALRLVNLTSIWAFEVAGTAARWRHCAPPLEHTNCRQVLSQCKSFLHKFSKITCCHKHKIWVTHFGAFLASPSILVYRSWDNCGVSFPKLLFRALLSYQVKLIVTNLRTF